MKRDPATIERLRVEGLLNDAKVAELHRFGVTVMWVAVTPLELQALCDPHGPFVPTSVVEQARCGLDGTRAYLGPVAPIQTAPIGDAMKRRRTA